MGPLPLVSLCLCQRSGHRRYGPITVTLHLVRLLFTSQIGGEHSGRSLSLYHRLDIAGCAITLIKRGIINFHDELLQPFHLLNRGIKVEGCRVCAKIPKLAVVYVLCHTQYLIGADDPQSVVRNFIPFGNLSCVVHGGR